MLIVQMTSVHKRYDTRIFLKQCQSLVSLGARVVLIVADGLGDESNKGVEIVDVGKPSGRINRMSRTTFRVFQKALEFDADVYQIHDPELLPMALRLKARGKKVIFDSHEDVPLQILSKPYMNPLSRALVSWVYAMIERFAVSRLSFVIAATPSIKSKFRAMGCPVEDVNNYPLLNELMVKTSEASAKKRQIAYVGGFSEIRGIIPLVRALELVEPDVELVIAGECSEPKTKALLETLPGWRHVTLLGFVGREQVADLLAQSVAGMVTFLAAPNHVEAQPNKLFEYMSAGVPVIGSNFPLWSEVIEANRCGLCVDPSDPKEIAAAIQYLLNNTDVMSEMGDNGGRMVVERYNWEMERAKLVRVYEHVVGEPLC